jgi:hypothetical protein
MKPLRKRHLHIWALFAFLIPFGIIGGYIAVPKQVLVELLQKDNTTALSLVNNTIEKKDYSVYLRSDAAKKNYQLQWVNKRESTFPSSLIYKISNGGNELIGRVASTGSYFFPVKADSTNTYSFILYDIIHSQIIDTIKFQQ